MEFYLGTHRPRWLEAPEFEGISLFVSRRRLAKLQRDFRSRTRWALDSGGFTELSLHGEWTVSPRQYAGGASRFQDRIGKLDFAAIQDWMCEPEMLEKTGKTIRDHQHLTVRSLIDLRSLAPQVPWMPVLQGWQPEDYLRHLDLYDQQSIDLTREPIVGIGSVCRRQDTSEAEQIMQVLYRIGVRLHGFGFKWGGLIRAGKYLQSADSMAWSYRARYRPVKLPGCRHKSCQNCPRYARIWRRQLLSTLGKHL